MIREPGYSTFLLTSLPQLPPSYKQKLEEFKRWQDSQASLIGRSLLIAGMKSYNHDIDLNHIQYTEHGKPFIDSCPIQFNISHSGKWVVCAFTEMGKIGIDIQQICKTSISNFERIISKNDFKKISESDETETALLDFWVRREAVSKADGRGILISLSSVDVLNNIVSVNKIDYFLNKIGIDSDYICYSATTHKPSLPIVKFVV